jgi:hypothetical protein
MIERFYEMAQYNFKISEELKEKVEKVLGDSGLDGKNEFLEDMIAVYSSHLVNRDTEVSVDMSAYKHINGKTKEVLEKTFLHLLSSMDYNFSSVLQEKLFIEEEKKRLADKSLELDGQVDRMRLELLEEHKILEAKYDDRVRVLLEEKEALSDKLHDENSQLVKVKEELLAISIIAEQTSLIIEENKGLRATVSLIEKEHKEEIIKLSKRDLENRQVLEEKYLLEVDGLKGNVVELEGSFRVEERKLFEVSHTLGRCEEDLRLFNNKKEHDLKSFNQREVESRLKFDGVVKELREVSSLYNQLLGKVEVFESLGKDNNLIMK